MTVTKIFPFGGSAPRIEQDDLDRAIVGGKGLGLVSFVMLWANLFFGGYAS